MVVEVKKASGVQIGYTGRGWHLLGGPQEANAFLRFGALFRTGHPFCTAEVLPESGALQNGGLKQERNAVAMNQVKPVKLR